MINYNGKYCDFFDIDEKYFPCIDDSAISSGEVDWTDTFPHKTFVDLLKSAERMLSGNTRSLWIHGAYGTGKSRCAYALKKILDVPDNELSEYWYKFDNLKNNQELLTKFKGHKERGVLTCYRYASGNITNPRELFFAIQETIKNQLILGGYNLGTGSLKDSVINWLSEDTHKSFFDSLLNTPKWASVFSQSSTDEVLKALNSGRDVKDLMDNIFSLAELEGITAMNIDADILKSWIKDVIFENNGLKIVFLWDEFSGFFKQNRNSLDEFQKIVSLCQEVPFYLVVVTHQTSSLINQDDQSWQVVKQRFDFSEITLPSNIAFDLIGAAMKTKSVSKDIWDTLANSLNGSLSDSRREVMKAANITNPKVIKDIMPLHPMAALVLKNIASSFQANQRSMFDFIKTNNNDSIEAFQWFIKNTKPLDNHPLLTIDLLWNFFYENGKDGLTSDIRMILDTFNQQKDLREDEKKVLKTILIMQAIDKKIGGEIDLLKPTEQNLTYAFEGVSDMQGTKCINIAKALKNKGVLVLTTIGNNKHAYGAAVLAGDQSEIDKYKEDIRKKISTAALVNEGDLSIVLSLAPALRLRFAEDMTDGKMIPVTNIDFTRTMNTIKNRISPYHFNAVIALSKNAEESVAFRKVIKEAANNDEYKDIVIIDALSTPLSENDFESYVEYSALANYYTSRNKLSAEENARKAKNIIAITWKNRIYNGQFIVYYNGNRNGEIVNSGIGVANILQKIVLSKYPYIFDFTKGVTEIQLKLTKAKVAAKCALDGKTSSVMINVEKYVLPDVWNVNKYWEKSEFSALPIVRIKQKIEEMIEENLGAEGDGKISISTICDCLTSNFGFAPCNLTAFLCAFLIKEYSLDPYRYLDHHGEGSKISSDKLAEMIKNYMDIKKPLDSWIVKMTSEEMEFYNLTKQAWGIESGKNINTAEIASMSVKNKMQQLKLPIWALKDIDKSDVYYVIKKYIELVKSEGPHAHGIAIEIGKMAINKPSLGENLKTLITSENCKEGMLVFLSRYQEGKLLEISKEIGAYNHLIDDIANLFAVESSSLWKEDTGTDEIEKLYIDYSFIKVTNELLNILVSSKNEAFNAWSDKLKFAICSSESLIGKYPEMSNIWNFLLKIYQRSEILPAHMKNCTTELIDCKSTVKEYFDNEDIIFKELYSPYLEEIERSDIIEFKLHLAGIFKDSKTKANESVKNVAAEFLQTQLKSQLFKLWREKTKTKSPLEWSRINRTPILAVVKKTEYDKAQRTFGTLNRGSGTEIEINEALEYLSSTDLFDYLNNEDVITESFGSLLGKSKLILADYEKVRYMLEKLPVDTYVWNSNPSVKDKIKELAEAEYNAGGSDRAIEKIEKMELSELKKYLIDLVKEKVDLGLEILNGGK